MDEESIALKRLTVMGEKNNINVVQNDLFQRSMLKEIRIYSYSGEKDILKTIQLLPGVHLPGRETQVFMYVVGR